MSLRVLDDHKAGPDQKRFTTAADDTVDAAISRLDELRRRYSGATAEVLLRALIHYEFCGQLAVVSSSGMNQQLADLCGHRARCLPNSRLPQSQHRPRWPAQGCSACYNGRPGDFRGMVRPEELDPIAARVLGGVEHLIGSFDQLHGSVTGRRIDGHPERRRDPA
jgi:hypothetical protein